MMLPQVHVVGASGRSGASLCQALAAQGAAVVPVVRSAARWAATGLAGTPRVADLAEPRALAEALAGAGAIVSCAHARYAGAILAAAPDARFVFLGSTRKFTRFPDAHGDGVLAGETALMASGRRGIMLHPTMIYGAEGEDNVRRLARLAALPVLPLPGGGRALVQPIHQDDVTRCILAALDRPGAGPESVVIAGPQPVSYADFVSAVAVASGRRSPFIVAVPAWALMAASGLTVLPGLPRVRVAEIRRLLEDKSFDVAPMFERLGVIGRELGDGLADTFRRQSPKSFGSFLQKRTPSS